MLYFFDSLGLNFYLAIINYCIMKRYPTSFFRRGIWTILLIFLVLFVSAQRTIRGKVVDPKGEALLGVNVLVKGTTQGSTTDASGQFAIVAGENSTLVFSFVGYLPKEVLVAGQSQINVTLAGNGKHCRGGRYCPWHQTR